MDPNPLPPKCAEKFTAERLLATGGFGSVWLATQKALDRQVAVKVLHGETLADPELVDRFLNEARITASLNHPNIVKLIDHGVDGSIPWIAYEYVPGRSLRDAVKSGGMPWPDVLRVGMQVASALNEAHSRGILHRDIKPDNVLEAGKEYFKVADFGIAKWSGEGAVKTQAGVILGTPAYISPMQIAGQLPSAHSDLYALGIMLFELLTGRVPFFDENLGEMLRLHRVRDVPKAKDYRPEVPEEVDRIVGKLLAKMREERYANSHELMADLDRALEKAPRTPTDVRVDAPGAGSERPLAPQPRPSGVSRPVRSSAGSGSATRPSIAPRPSHTVAVSPPARGRSRALIAALVVASGLAIAAALLRQRPAPPPVAAPLPERICARDGAYMRLVRGGRFEALWDDPGRQRHRVDVTLADFYMDEFETTNALYARFSTATGTARSLYGAELMHPKQPVAGVTYEQAAAYCAWAGKRLPAEAEWEHAARGPAHTKFPWGDRLDTQFPQANYRDASFYASGDIASSNMGLPNALLGDDHFPVAAPVGSFQAGQSHDGIFDLSGNVSEWCTDEYPFAGAPREDGRLRRSIRGGSWNEGPDDLRTNARRGQPVEDSNRAIGFRGVLTAADAMKPPASPSGGLGGR